jgi:hypothetical protein
MLRFSTAVLVAASQRLRARTLCEQRMLTQLVCKHSQTKNAHVGSLGRVVGDVQHRQQHTVRRSGIICCGVADELTVSVSRRRRARRAAGCKAARRVSGMRPGGWHAGQQSARGSTRAATSNKRERTTGKPAT